MAVSSIVISAYARRFSREQIETALDIALADRASGVLVTQASFQDGSGSGQIISGDPNEVIEILELVLRQLDAPDSPPPGLVSAVDFRSRRAET